MSIRALKMTKWSKLVRKMAIGDPRLCRPDIAVVKSPLGTPKVAFADGLKAAFAISAPSSRRGRCAA